MPFALNCTDISVYCYDRGLQVTRMKNRGHMLMTSELLDVLHSIYIVLFICLVYNFRIENLHLINTSCRSKFIIIVIRKVVTRNHLSNL